MNKPVLSSLHIYPVKSLTGIQVKQWPVVANGLKYDRQWMLVDSDYTFLTRRQHPELALIDTQINNDKLILSTPGFEDISIPLNPQLEPLVTVKIWQDHCQGALINHQIDQWFSDFLQIPCHLIYQPESSIRHVDQNYATPDDPIYFSDGFPFLLTSEASLAKLNQDAGLDFAMSRFRPNLVISGCASFEEDFWREISIGAINFRLPKPCSRCVATTITPGTATFGKEPLSTLNRTRKWQKKVYFGQNAIHNNIGMLTQGELLTILKTGLAQPPLA